MVAAEATHRVPELKAHFFALIVVAAYAAACILLTPSVFAGRFWAEEGRDLYGPFQSLDLWHQLTFRLGYLMLPANVLVALARLAGHPYAPIVTTFGGFAIQLLLVGLVCVWHAKLGISRTAAVLVAILMAILPHFSEPWANATNLQWLFAAVAAVVLMAPADGSRAYRAFACGTLLVCGLSGVPSAFLMPAFAFKAFLERNRASIAQFLFLFAPALIQAFLVAAGRNDLPGPRSYPLDPDLYISAATVQAFTTPFLGFPVAEKIAHLYAAGQAWFVPWVKLAGLAAIAGIFSFGICYPATRKRSLLLGAAFIACIVVGIFSVLGDPRSLIAGVRNGRYFFVPNVILLLQVAHLSSALPVALLRYVGMALLGTMVVVHAVNWPASLFFFQGPSWSAQLPPGPITQPLRVEIWPRGWEMILRP